MNWWLEDRMKFVAFFVAFKLRPVYNAPLNKNKYAVLIFEYWDDQNKNAVKKRQVKILRKIRQLQSSVERSISNFFWRPKNGFEALDEANRSVYFLSTDEKDRSWKWFPRNRKICNPIKPKTKIHQNQKGQGGGGIRPRVSSPEPGGLGVNPGNN